MSEDRGICAGSSVEKSGRTTRAMAAARIAKSEDIGDPMAAKKRR